MLPPRPSLPRTSMKKILIIEDDQLVANIYRNKFAVEDYQVEIAPDGETGFEVHANLSIRTSSSSI